MTKTYTTITDLIDREIVGALDGVAANFDLDGFVQTLRDRGLIKYSAKRQGFRLVTDEDGNTPGFWDIVAEFDTDEA